MWNKVLSYLWLGASIALILLGSSGLLSLNPNVWAVLDRLR